MKHADASCTIVADRLPVRTVESFAMISVPRVGVQTACTSLNAVEDVRLGAN